MIDVLESLADRDLGAHSSIILTYGLDLPLYDGLVRRKLAAAGARNQVVFCDLGEYEAALDAVAVVRHLGRTYSVTPVHQAGAFHPKLYLMLGRRQGRLVVGSGNSTVGGLVRNAEVFSRFDFDENVDDHPHTAFRVVAQLAHELSRNAGSAVRAQVERALSWSPWLQNEPRTDERSILVSGPGRPSLLEQIRERLEEVQPRRGIVVSSSFDRKLQALRRVAKLCPGGVACVVRSEDASVDGKSVAALGNAVEWHEFVDPQRAKKAASKDVRLHAKVFIFQGAEKELALVGSANASEPALLSPTNTEAVVVVRGLPVGTIASRLGLEPSLTGPSIGDQMQAKVYEESAAPAHRDLVVLSALVDTGAISVLLVGEPPTGAALELRSHSGRSGGLRLALHKATDTWLATVALLPGNARLALVVDRNGAPLSNEVALTWPDVARFGGHGWFGQRVEAAVNAMHGGLVIGTVLFELLEQVPDFDVILRRGGRGTDAHSPKDEPEDQAHRTTDSFYSERTASGAAQGSFGGERSDLDLLASLVQPLRQPGTPAGGSTDDGEDEDELEATLNEEAQRRDIDNKKGKARGDEGQEAQILPSARTLERSAARLERRLERSAQALEDAYADLLAMDVIPANALARQVWMCHIGAFLSGREVEAAEGGTVLALEPLVFADFVLRIARCLAGGRKGGVLGKMSGDLWGTADGRHLRDGLRFLWTCVAWAVGQTNKYWADADEDEIANGPCDGVPWLVGARFVAAVQPICGEPDLKNLATRLPAAFAEGEGELTRWLESLSLLGECIAALEQRRPATSNGATGGDQLTPGCPAFNEATGVTLVRSMSSDKAKCDVVDLDRTGDATRTFVRGKMTPVELPATDVDLNWREWESDEEGG